MIDEPEKFSAMSQSGYIGLNIFDGISNDELVRDLNFPTSVKTFKQMSYHPAINAPLTLYQNLISKVTWRVVPPADATEEEKERAKIIESMMHDMEVPWKEFISEALTAQTYGFSILEKVYRKRKKSKGSKFDDGLIAWKKIPLRAQESIDKFIYDERGDNIIGVKQDPSKLGSAAAGRYALRTTTAIVLPKAKFLHFRVGKHRGDPFGKSPLRDAYTSWKYLTAIEEIEAHGVAKDLSGLPILSIPPQYLSDDATPSQKAMRAYWENSMRNLQMNQQSAMILPNAYDPETRQPLFKLELLSLDGKKAMDTGKVKDYYKNLIFNTMFASVLTMGDNGTGSFALGQIKNSLTGVYAESLLDGIVETLNTDLMRQTYELNDWDTSRLCRFDYEQLESDDLDTFSRAIQRMSSVGLIPKTIDVVNRVLGAVGVDALPEDSDLTTLLPDNTSKAGEGFKTPFEGTRQANGGQNDNDNNLENSP
jgi:hypothetical protein